ncbi:hypothetical protein NDU88_000363 [Pleurodeles waltl]|uniref:Uncharacterized protein n=1 Tax=Pleurodeles waltl TaxID=8319 RepID=A0AAV7UR37_PLEWA|nr:hypothetical protein NDU88_000363 [Pleurodeles waltl]
MQLSPLRKAPWEPRVGCRADVAAGSRHLPSGPPQPMNDKRAGARCLSGVTAGSRRLKKQSPAVDVIQENRLSLVRQEWRSSVPGGDCCGVASPDKAVPRSSWDSEERLPTR